MRSSEGIVLLCSRLAASMLKEIAFQLKNAAEIVLDRAELIALTGYKTAPPTAGAVFCAYKKG